MADIIKLHAFQETDRQKSVKETLKDFHKFCDDEKAEGVICIAYRRGKDKELIASFASHLRFTEKMGMLEEARARFIDDNK